MFNFQSSGVGPTPFTGKPVTIQGTKSDGSPTFMVRAKALHPFGAKIARRVGFLAGPAVAIAEITWLVMELPNVEPIGWAALVVAPFVAPLVVRSGLALVLQTERQFKFDVTGVRVQTWTASKHYSLDLPIRFALIAHDREKIEAERLTYLNRKLARRFWWFPQLRAYFDKSCHLSLDHFDQRSDVMTIFGKSNARRIVARLNACLDVVRNHGRAGQGTAFDAEADWSRQPGAIIDMD